jgi:hypothetical protein
MYISILNMATVFSQMHGNPVCTRQFCQHSRCHWIRFYGSSCLPNCGNVVDIDAKRRQSQSPADFCFLILSGDGLSRQISG